MSHPRQASIESAWPVLETSGWLATRASDVRERLKAIAKLRHFDSGDYLYRAGDASNGVFGLVRGVVEALIPRLDGQEIVAHRAEAGYWVGDLALFARQKRLISLRAATEVSVAWLPQQEVKTLLDSSPELIADFYQLTHENTALILTLLGNLAIPGAEQRVALRLLVQADRLEDAGDWVQMPQQTLAELVALSPQSVRRSLRSLEDQGLVEVGYGRIRVVDRQGLAQLCGYALKHPKG